VRANDDLMLGVGCDAGCEGEYDEQTFDMVRAFPCPPVGRTRPVASSMPKRMRLRRLI
jgi:hypothetical protein